jgi:predicted nucleic acid-binding protein
LTVSTPTRVVVADANILINLCHARSLVLLEQLPGYEFVVPGEVDAEITDPEQRRLVDELFARGKVQRQSLASAGELAIYAELRTVMGSGEASCIALAQIHGLHLASDERSAFLREAKTRVGENRLLNTPGLFVLAIRSGLLTTAEADAAKAVLEQRRFTMRFASFADVFSSKK